MCPILQTFTEGSDCIQCEITSLHNRAHQKLGTPVGCCLSTEPCAHLWLHMTSYGVPHWSMKAWRNGTFMECFFFFFLFWFNRYMEAICKFPLETWLRAFQACLRGSPLRATFLYSALSWFHVALSFPSPRYHLNPHFMCLFIRSFIHSLHQHDFYACDKANHGAGCRATRQIHVSLLRDSTLSWHQVHIFFFFLLIHVKRFIVTKLYCIHDKTWLAQSWQSVILELGSLGSNPSCPVICCN